MKDENGDPIHMLNVFAQTLKLHLISWSVHGDKTNEPGCLKNLLEELFTMYWEVENCLHLQKDRYYREDKHVLGRDSWGEAWTILTNIALSLAQLLRRNERNLKEVRERCHANPKKTAKKLGLA
jgi:hypothetical protein